jgi:DNA/RNA-binding protein KIN17
MAKHEFLTPKAIANRIKAKGLQRLRWYCQICEKQCRDENGFKCHCMSESHQRQMELFSQNPAKFMDNYTRQFKNDFLALLKRRFGERRVFANMVYQEYIKDRQHIHMNATTWATLSDFVKYLGREGICTVEDTEQGWYITYIDRSPETLARLAAREKKEKMELDEEERHRKLIEEQVERTKASLHSI